MKTSAEPVLGEYLETGESLLWAGVPKQGVILRSIDVFMIPFSIFWCGFAIFWVLSAFKTTDSPFFALFGVPFVLVGFYMVAGRFFVDSRARANTYYGLTDRRVLIVSGLFSRTIKSLPLATLHDLSVKEKIDRSGTIMFGRPHPFAGWYEAMPWPGTEQYQTPSFELIEDAQRVHEKVLEAQRAEKSRTHA